MGNLSIHGICTLTRQPVHTFPSCLMSNANVKELRLKHWDLRKDLFSSEPPLTQVLWVCSPPVHKEDVMEEKKARPPSQGYRTKANLQRTKETCVHSTQKNDIVPYNKSLSLLLSIYTHMRTCTCVYTYILWVLFLWRTLIHLPMFTCKSFSQNRVFISCFHITFSTS